MLKPRVPATISDRQFYQQLAIAGIITEHEALAANAAIIPPPLLDIIDEKTADQQFIDKDDRIWCSRVQAPKSPDHFDRYGIWHVLRTRSTPSFWPRVSSNAHVQGPHQPAKAFLGSRKCSKLTSALRPQRT